MLQSLSYRDVDWQYKEAESLLEVKMKGSSKGGVCVHTKQVFVTPYICGSRLCFLLNKP